MKIHLKVKESFSISSIHAFIHFFLWVNIHKFFRNSKFRDLRIIEFGRKWTLRKMFKTRPSIWIQATKKKRFYVKGETNLDRTRKDILLPRQLINSLQRSKSRSLCLIIRTIREMMTIWSLVFNPNMEYSIINVKCQVDPYFHPLKAAMDANAWKHIRVINV